MGFDKEQYHMVSEALQERANLVEIAPHLAYALPIMLPVYSYWQIPYFWVGIKVMQCLLILHSAAFSCISNPYPHLHNDVPLGVRFGSRSTATEGLLFHR